MTRSAETQLLLDAADPALGLHVAALEAENQKLQRRIAKLEAEQVSLKNCISALREEIQNQGVAAIDRLIKNVQGRALPVVKDAPE